MELFVKVAVNGPSYANTTYYYYLKKQKKSLTWTKTN